MDEQRNGIEGWVLLCGFALPLSLMTLWSFFVGVCRGFLPEYSIWLAFPVCVGVGLVGLARLPWRAIWLFGLACVIYVPTIVVLLLIYTLVFVGVMFGQFL